MPGSAHKSRKDVQVQVCLPAELLDIGRVRLHDTQKQVQSLIKSIGEARDFGRGILLGSTQSFANSSPQYDPNFRH
jgi:hypothetical protein